MSKCALILISFLALLTSQAHPQSRPETQFFVQKAAADHESVVNGNDALRERMQQELISRTVVERQAKLKQDTEKLLTLAAELKQHVDKTGPNILSLEVIKKAQEIEKLAKSVREKMRDAY